MPVVIGALGSVTKELNGQIEKLGIKNNSGGIQKTALIGALVSVTKEFHGQIEKLGIKNNAGRIQKTALLGTARILREVLEILKENIILLAFGDLV